MAKIENEEIITTKGEIKMESKIKTKWKLHFAMAVLIIGIISLANADTLNIPPCDDMYTDPNGTQATGELWVANWPGCGGHYERIMLKFDLSELTGQTIDSATLNLYKFFTAPDGSPTATCFYGIIQQWNEETWPSTQHIQHDNIVWASQTFTSQLGWYDIDITDLVQAWIDGTVTNYGLVIIANPGYKFSKFRSKEATNPNEHPYLEVIYTPSEYTIEIPLNVNWNWISFNVHPDDTSLDAVFASLIPPACDPAKIYQVKNQTKSATYIYPPGVWIGNLTEISDGEGYLVKMLESAPDYSLTGMPIEVSTPIELNVNWNWIAYYPQYPLPVGDALSSIEPNGFQVKNQTQSATYYEGIGWLGDLSVMEEGVGYKLKMLTDDILIYPESK